MQGGDFKDDAFREGLTEDRAKEILGHPEGNPENWVVGGPDKSSGRYLDRCQRRPP